MTKAAILSIALLVAVVVPSLVASGVQAATGPTITSVLLTPLIPARGLEYMIINGVDFGTGPVTVPANYAGPGPGVDTVKSSVTPSLGICDIRGGVQQWNAGGKYSGSINVGSGCTVGGYNDIGIFLKSWTDTQIVVSGFGGNIFGFHIHSGDTLVFVVFGPSNSGYSTYVTYYNGPSV